MRRQHSLRAPSTGASRALACLVVAGSLLLPASPAHAGTTSDPTVSPTATQTAGAAPTTSTASPPTTTPASPDGTATTARPTTPTTPPPSSPAPPPPGDGENALTPEQVAAQVAQAKQLRGALSESDAKLAALGQDLAEAAIKAAAALERMRTAQRTRQSATDDLHASVRQLATLQAQAAQSEEDMGRWARDAYVAGGSIASYQGWITVLQGDAVGDTSHDLAVLEHLGVLNGQELERILGATARQRAVADRAASAARTAVKAADEATAAKKEADALLQEQRAVLVQVQVEQLKTVGSAEAARAELARSKDADVLAAAAELSAALRSTRSGTPVPIDPSQCTSLSTAGYANGEIPAATLCPLWGAPGQMLRGDAARAFTALSKEYATVFGRPICVTDSYRSRGQQVILYATKPDLAARPGTSNHGWGTATDLCGGVESFGTAEHAWLLSHAPLYGWFHPSWAEPTGSRPEPWHWEYAG
ncbi:MAG TPA: M15 family metallopeptidase [Actinomycetales bacterium]|nr:M15 family metallopeptidase [Actinomycetales bacterium]